MVGKKTVKKIEGREVTPASAVKKKLGRRWAIAVIALAAVGLAALLASNYFTQQELVREAPEDIAQILQGARVIESKTEVFTKEVTPMTCEGVKDLVYWRELRVYNVTKQDVLGRITTSYYSTITLSVENKGTQTIKNFVLAEKIPSEVAQTPGELMNFTIKPSAMKVGSVVVEWMFEQVQPGEKKEVSYTVEKKLSKETLAGFEAPRVITQAIEAGAHPTPTPQQAGFDYLMLGVVFAVIIAAGVGYYFLKKRSSP